MFEYSEQRSGIWQRVTVFGLIAAATSLAVAAPASADQRAYLTALAPRWAYLSPDQLLTEGHKVCNYINAGNTASAAADMVRADLTVNVDVASEIVITAVKQLGC
jgi:uncharacterized protein DUF732